MRKNVSVSSTKLGPARSEPAGSQRDPRLPVFLEIDVPKAKAEIHNVIFYCKANTEKLLLPAIDMIMR